MIQAITLDEKIKLEPLCLRSKTVTNNMKSIIDKVKKNDNKNSGVNSKYYRGENSEVVKLLQVLYYCKCAFCESKLIKPDIEHFRPQGLNKYYWLGYEWTNILPICSTCNETKNEDFPIAGKSSCDVNQFLTDKNELSKDSCSLISTILIKEKPLLIHPEIDIPKSFISFLPNGRLEGIDSDGKGETTIITYGLNDIKMGSERVERGDLVRNRKRILDDLIEAISDGLNRYIETLVSVDEQIESLKPKQYNFSKYRKRHSQKTTKTDLPILKKKASDDFYNVIFKEIRMLDYGKQHNQSFSFVSSYIWDNFDTIVLSRFDFKIASDIKEIFDIYIKEGYRLGA